MSTKLMLVMACTSLPLIGVAGDGGKKDDQGAGPTVKTRLDSLKGLAGVYLLAEPLSPDVERAGLTSAQLRADVELRLRSSGIRVLSRKDVLKQPGTPHLYLNVNLVKSESEFWVFDISLEFMQETFLKRNRDGPFRAETWGIGATGYATGGRFVRIREKLRDLTDRFCNDYLAANPKGEPGKHPKFEVVYDGSLPACKRWARDEDYIQKLIWDYEKLKSFFPEEEVVQAAKDACQDRVITEREFVECRECVEEIVRALYKKDGDG